MPMYTVFLEAVFPGDEERCDLAAADDIDMIRKIVELKKTHPHFPKIKRAYRWISLKPLNKGVSHQEDISPESLDWLRRLWDEAHYEALYRDLVD